MVDYSKWDNLQDSDDDADVLPKSALPSSTSAATITQQVRPSMKHETTILLNPLSLHRARTGYAWFRATT